MHGGSTVKKTTSFWRPIIVFFCKSRFLLYRVIFFFMESVSSFYTYKHALRIAAVGRRDGHARHVKHLSLHPKAAERSNIVIIIIIIVMVGIL